MDVIMINLIVKAQIQTELYLVKYTICDLQFTVAKSWLYCPQTNAVNKSI